jgi:hypothetical protein
MTSIATPKDGQEPVVSEKPAVPSGKENVELNRGPTGGSRPRYRLVILAAAGLFIVIALGLGLGLGLGLKHHHHDLAAPSSTPSSATPSSAPSPSPPNVLSATALGTLQPWRRDTLDYSLDMNWDLNAPPTTRLYNLTVSEIQAAPDGTSPLYILTV